MATDTQIYRIEIQADDSTREVLRLQATLAQAEASMIRAQNASQRLNNQLNNYKNGLGGVSNAQQGAANTSGMFATQLGDVFTQIASGGDPLRALAVQLNQVQQQMAVTSKATTGFAGFLAGPWGAAVSIAVLVLAPLISSLFDTGDAAEEAAKKADELAEAQRNAEDAALTYEQANNKLKASLDESFNATEANIKAELRLNGIRIQAALDSLRAAQSNWALAKSQAAVNAQYIAAGRAIGGASGLILEGYGRVREWWQGNKDIADEANKSMADSVALISKLEASQLGGIADLFAEGRDKASRRSRGGTRRGASRGKSEADSEAERLKKEIEELANVWRKGGPDIAAATAEFEKLSAAFKMVTGVTFGEGDVPAEWQRFGDAVDEARAKLEALQDPLSALTNEYTAIEREQQKLELRLGLINDELERAVDTGYIEWLKAQAVEIEKKLNPAYGELLPKVEEFIKAIEKAEQANALLEKGGRGGEAAGRIREQIEAFELQLSLLDQNSVAAEILRKQIAALSLEYERLQLSGLNGQLFDLAVKGINDFADGIGAAIEGTKSWGDAFKDVAKSIIAELTKIIVKLAIVNAIKAAGGPDLGSFFGFAKGGVIANGQRVTPYATGGIVDRPMMFPMRNGMGLMGEAGPEAIMPLRRGASGKLGVEASKPQVNVQVINNAGAQVRTEQDRNGDLQIFIEAARREIAGDIARGGGVVSRSLEGTYGMSRARR